MNLTLRRPGYKALLIFLMVSFGFTLILYFIDEGRYSFEEITLPANVFALSFYFAGMTLAQGLALAIAERYVEPTRAMLSSIIVGIPVGILLTILFFSLVGS